jgi:FtsZ-binding cell division protein ZapB
MKETIALLKQQISELENDNDNLKNALNDSAVRNSLFVKRIESNEHTIRNYTAAIAKLLYQD